MQSDHYRNQATFPSSIFGRFFCFAILMSLVAAAGVTTARAQDAGTATPTVSAPSATAETSAPTNTPAQTAAPTLTLAASTSTPISPFSTAVKLSPTSISPTQAATVNSTKTTTPTLTPILSSQVLPTPTPNKYFTSQTITTSNGVTLGDNIINGPPAPPPGTEAERKVVSQNQIHAASSTILDVPAYEWSLGCSATSGAMIAAYYDQNGFPNMYTGPTNSGVAPSTSGPWPNWTDGTGYTYAQDPLAASHNGLDGRTGRGSIDDYWVGYGSSAQDPFIGNWTQHTWGSAIGDFMKTSQSNYGNTDGSTSFYYIESGSPYTCSTMAAQGISQNDGTYGRKLFYESRGYTVTDCYSQETDNQYSGGFSFAQYEAEIDAGHPVMLNLAGHTIVGIGYDASTTPGTVYLHDTWDYNTHTMLWGSSYSNMILQSVSVVNLLQSTNPVPSITNLSPSSALAGGSAFSLTVNGTNFVNGSVVNWNTTALSTTYVNSSQLKATVPANLIASTGSAAVTVFNPTPGGGTSSAQTIPINNPLPSTTSLSPTSVLVGGSTFSLTVNGSNFISSSVVNWNGAALSTTFVSSSQLTSTVPANLIASTGSASVAVINPTPGGGTSSAQTFTIINPLPSITSLDPGNTLVGGSTFSLTVHGTNFVSSSVINWNGSALITSDASSSQLSAAVPTNLIASTGSAAVTVVNPTPGGGTSPSQNFEINNPLPILSSISQNSALIGSSAFTLTANGSNFVSSSVVNWNGAALSTTFAGSTQLTAAVPASKLTNAGTVSITVFSPAPGGGASSAQTFTLNNPLPVVSSLSPTIRAIGTQAFTLSVSGSNFAAGATVRWNGSGLASTFVSSSLLTASVPATDLTSTGTIAITVFNPPPGGGLSAGSLNFTLTSIDPAYGATVTNLRPTFDWPAVDGATSYNLQVSKSSTLASPFLNKTFSTASYLPTADIPGSSPIYWRVRSYVNKVWGAWSETRLFYSPNPPKVISLVSPANNALITNYLPTLDWSDASLPAGTTFDHYDLQIASDAGFTTGLLEPTITPATTSAYTFTNPLTPNSGYYWRVRAFNSFGQSGSWSSVYYLKAAMLPPSLQLPADGLSPAQLAARPDFSWKTVDGASSYTFQIASTSNFSKLIVNTKVTSAAYTPTIDLPKNTVLYWRVQAQGTYGPSLWSTPRSFTSANSPSAPKLSSPVANALVTSSTSTFYWSPSTLPVGVSLSYYQIQISADATFITTTIDDQQDHNSQTNYAVSSGSLLANTKYYWRVRTYGNNGHYSSWSSVLYFRSAMLAPSIPSQGSGDPVSSLRPLFDWGDVGGASTYTLEVSTITTFGSLTLNKTVASSNYTPTSNLPSKKLLYWRVRANGVNGPSLWSEIDSFSTP